MRTIFRSLVLAPVVMAAVALATTTAKAASTLNVPFSFTAAGKSCPAGLYTVEKDTFRGVVIFKSKEAPRSFTWLLRPGDATLTGSKVVLKFDPQGETHALQSIQYGTLITSRLDKKSKQNEHRPVQTVQGEGQ
jgi:hypothetical protein